MPVFGKKAQAQQYGMLPEDKRWLLHHTDFNEAQLEEMYALFKKDYPRGGMFRSQFSAFFPPGLATINFCDHVFRTLDTDGNGFLDFKVTSDWLKYSLECSDWSGIYHGQ